MIEYIKGHIEELTPAAAVLDVDGLGYLINISLNTFDKIQKLKECKLYIYEVIREDTHSLFGFESKDERSIFLLLIGVSGIGANTARMILSSMSVDELKLSIVGEDVNSIKSVKGIGLKTAQRLIVELKDKIEKLGVSPTSDGNSKFVNNSETRVEALAALQMLGFNASSSQKVVSKILKAEPNLKVELVVKKSLKML